MRRLTYSPKAYVFIRSRSQNGKIYDLTDLVVGGEIVRNINMPSTAEVVIKNKNFQLSANEKDPIFQPMDGITIWLQRIAGNPIQVFTGYLNSVPYYQMYPGNATFSATCTLKRLMRTWFDPGLPTMMQWFAKYGWVDDPKTGMITNFPSNFTTLTGKGGSGFDGGFGQLLRQFMVEICGWDGTSVLISDLPQALPQKALSFFNQIQSEQQVVTKEFENFLSQIMSVSVNHDDNSVNSTSIGSVVKKIYDTSSSFGNIDPVILVLSAICLSGLVTTLLDNDPNSPTFGAGLYDIPPDQTNIQTPATGTSYYDTNRYDGYGTNLISDPTTSTKSFILRLQKNFNAAQVLGHWPKITDSPDILAQWIGSAANKLKYKAELTAAIRDNLDSAKKLVSTFAQGSNASVTSNITGTSFDTLIGGVMPDNITWSNIWLDTTEKTTGSTFYRTVMSNQPLVKYLWVSHQYDLKLLSPLGSIPTAKNFITGGNTIGVGGDVSDASLLSYAQWAGSQPAQKVVLLLKDKLYVWNSAIPQISSNDPTDTEKYISQGYQYNIVYVTAAANSVDPKWTGKNVTSSVLVNAANPNSPQDASKLTFQDLVKIDTASAFASQFSMPTNIFESMFLRGDKSLMNDHMVMDGVKEICAASMRNFMSLPSGEFVAFYPDYFGADGRKPYWSISDLEITNMGIQMSDDQLVTHAYVTGGTLKPGDTSYINEILTQGVVTIDKMFSSGNFISGLSDKALLREEQAFDFLNTYGASPLNKSMPMIRSHWYEFLYAWQLFMFKWAQLFQTKAEFTFQPEIMAGGLIEFPEHNLQMYVQQVSHTWDYAGGFNTTAQLMAPSLLTRGKTQNFPGMAIAGGIPGISGIGVVE